MTQLLNDELEYMIKILSKYKDVDVSPLRIAVRRLKKYELRNQVQLERIEELDAQLNKDYSSSKPKKNNYNEMFVEISRKAVFSADRFVEKSGGLYNNEDKPAFIAGFLQGVMEYD